MATDCSINWPPPAGLFELGKPSYTLKGDLNNAARANFIDKGETRRFRKKVGAIVYLAMVNTINVPKNDHFQMITEHDKNGLVYDPGYLDIPRTDGVISMR